MAATTGSQSAGKTPSAKGAPAAVKAADDSKSAAIPQQRVARSASATSSPAPRQARPRTVACLLCESRFASKDLLKAHLMDDHQLTEPAPVPPVQKTAAALPSEAFAPPTPLPASTAAPAQAPAPFSGLGAQPWSYLPPQQSVGFGEPPAEAAALVRTHKLRLVAVGAVVVVAAAIGIAVSAGSSGPKGFNDPQRLGDDIMATVNAKLMDEGSSDRMTSMTCIPAGQAHTFTCHGEGTDDFRDTVTATVSEDGSTWITGSG